MRAAVLSVLGLWLWCQSVVGSDSTGGVVKLGTYTTTNIYNLLALK